MAVTKQLADSNPYIADGICTSHTVQTITRADVDQLIPKAFNLCAHQRVYIEAAFAESGGVINDDYKNDKTDLLFGLSLTTDTVTIKLWKRENGVGVEKATLNDNTYGVYFANTVFDDQLKIGFVADWNLILDAFGVGIYYFTADRSIINQNSSLTSHWFNLKIFDEEEADGTIRVVTNQVGTIEGGIDYGSFEWTGYVRLYGFFGQPDYEFITENYITSSRVIEQIQNKIRTIYTMTLNLHPSSILIPFLKDRLLANDITITSYGVFDFLERYREIPVYPEAIEENNYFGRNTNGQFILTFTDKQQTPIKRRYT